MGAYRFCSASPVSPMQMIGKYALPRAWRGGRGCLNREREQPVDNHRVRRIVQSTFSAAREHMQDAFSDHVVTLGTVLTYAMLLTGSVRIVLAFF